MGDHLWILGVFLFFISQIMVCVGMQIQKCAHTRLQESSSNTHYVRNPRWIIGFSIQSLSAICDFFALAFASQSVLAPIASTTLIFNMCLTPVMQHERVCTKTVIITLCIAIGTVLTVIFSPKEQHNATDLESLFDIYRSWNFVIYAFITFVATGALWLLAVRSSLESTESTIFGFSGPTLSGIMSAQGKLLIKGVAAAFILSLKNKGELFLVHWEWYLLLFVGLFCLFWHIKWLNIGLQHFSPIHVVPICWTFNILLTIIGGLVVFKEYQDFAGTLDVILFSVGVLLTLASVLALSTVPQDAVSEEKLRKRSLSMYAVTPSWTYQGAEMSFMVPSLDIQHLMDNDEDEYGL